MRGVLTPREGAACREGSVRSIRTSAGAEMASSTEFRWQNAILQVTRGHHHSGQWSWEGNDDKATDAAKNDQRRISIVTRAMAKSPGHGASIRAHSRRLPSPQHWHCFLRQVMPETGCPWLSRCPFHYDTPPPCHCFPQLLGNTVYKPTVFPPTVPPGSFCTARPFPPSPNSSWRASLF